MEELSSGISYTDDDNRNLQMLLEAFGSMVSLEAIASAYCEALRDVYTAGEILCNRQGSTCSTSISGSKDELVAASASSEFSSDNPLEKSFAEGSSNLPKTRKRSVSMGTVSGVIGREYAKPRALATETSKATKPLKLISSELPASVIWGDNVSPDNGERSESMHKDLEEFMFKMLGDGFRLDKNVIHNVLGLCGYDVEKSMKKLLDLSASTLEKSDDVIGATAQNPMENSVDLEALERLQKSISRESSIGKASSLTRSDSGSRKRDKDRYDLQKEILETLFNVPERVEEAPKRILPVRTRSSSYVVTEPLEEIRIPDRKTVTVKSKFTEDEDDESENSYEVLRKAVKEYWSLMKHYYEAAVDAFAKADLPRANKLLEQGQFFMNKARVADERSAQKLIQNRDEVEEFSIDLQDHDPKGAIRLLKTQLPNLCGIPSIQYLKLTVGTNGSDPKDGARKRLIIKLLEKGSIKWTEEGDGWIIVIRVDVINPKSLKFG